MKKNTFFKLDTTSLIIRKETQCTFFTLKVKEIILDRKCFVHSMYSIILSNESLKFPIKMRTHIFIYNILKFISTSRKSSQEKKVTIILIILIP